MRKGVSIKFTIPVPDKYAPIQISLSSERDILPEEKPEDLMTNVAKELVDDLHKIAGSIVNEILEEEKKIMDELNED